MLGTLARLIAYGKFDRFGKRREWNAFEREVDATRLLLSAQINDGVPLEEVISTLIERDPLMKYLARKYWGGQPIETSLQCYSQMTQDERLDIITRRHLHKSSRRQMETTGQMAPVWEMVYNYANQLGYEARQVDALIFEKVA